jgi:hypothetical protein
LSGTTCLHNYDSSVTDHILARQVADWQSKVSCASLQVVPQVTQTGLILMIAPQPLLDR